MFFFKTHALKPVILKVVFKIAVSKNNSIHVLVMSGVTPAIIQSLLNFYYNAVSYAVIVKQSVITTYITTNTHNINHMDLHQSTNSLL